MKSLVLLLVTLCATLSVYAEVAVARFDFSKSGTSASGSNWPGEGNWSNAFVKACKARLNGIGIAPASSSGGQSGMKYTCPEGETEAIRQLAITCMASFKGTADADNIYTLGLAINEEIFETETFTFNGKIDTPHTIVFTFDDPIAASSIVITNKTDLANNSSLFEINAVEWQSDYSEIKASFSAPNAITIGTPITVELLSVSGGSGFYTESYFTFNGESIYVESGTGIVSFDGVGEDGTYPLTLTVTDSAGTQEIFTRTITVTAYVAPTNLTPSDITRNGFVLAWDQPLSTSITSYKAQIKPEPIGCTTPLISPTWKAVREAFHTETPIDLSEYLKAFPLKTLFLQAEEWTGDLSLSTDNGETWVTGSYAAKRWSFPNIAEDAKTFLLKTTETTPPQAIKFVISFDIVAEKTLPATGDNHILSITDLPPGETYSVTVSAIYDRGENESPLSKKSSVITVSLHPIPTFADVSVSPDYGTITLTWPEDDQDLEGCCQFFGTQFIPGDLPPGLYLTRVYLAYTPAQKAIAITNTSQNDIHLDGSYTYVITKTSTGTTTSWDFGVEDEDETITYPYTVPAGGELIFYSSAYPPAEIQAGAIPVNKNVLKSFTVDYTLSLKKGSTLCNSLTPVENATVRLKTDSTTETETDTSAPLDTLYTPWIELYKTVPLGEVTFESMNGQLQLYYSRYITNIENLQSAEVHCFLQDGASRSDKIVLPVYKAATATKPGFLLRLH